MPSPQAAFPLRLTGELDPDVGRWLWLFKWLLAIPHFIVLVFLWAAFLVLSAIAIVAVAFTGRYPRGLFDFNVGVLRWSWRVMNFRFPMNSTDKYPPFTLASRPDYPGDLEVDYPDHLTNWAVLVKWWLLAFPQIIICWAMEPLLQILCVINAATLLVTGSIHQGMFDLLMGIVRWRYRVAVYVSLMRDEYPPFRLDLG